MATSDILIWVGTFTEDPDEGIHHFRLDPTSGALTPAGTTGGVPNPFFLKVDATGQRLYATNAVDELDGRAEGGMSAFTIEQPSGELRLLNRQATGGTLPCYISLDRSGRQLLTGNYNSGSVAVLPIDADGLQPVSSRWQHEGFTAINPERQDGPHVHCMVRDPSERWAYAADLGADVVRVYAFDADSGSLTPAHDLTVTAKPGAGPRHIAFHPSGAYAYLLNELNGTLGVYAFDAESGRFDEIHTVTTLPADFTDENYAADVQLLPSGDFLYASNRGHDSIARFAVDAGSGRVEFIGHTPAEGSWPWNLAIDPTTNFMLVSNYESDRVDVLRIHTDTGDLTPTGHSAPAPKPTCVTMLAL